MEQTTVGTDALMEAMALIAAEPDVHWVHGDDLCDCIFQRIGSFANPYLGKTLKIRLCCIWEKIYEQFPEYVQRIDGYWDDNTCTYNPEPKDWDAVDWDMPKHLWNRQTAIREGVSLAEAREMNRGLEPPKAVKPLPPKRKYRRIS